ncbi:MAG TPA: beta-L-arabinofuranosidase domain-containing protein [Terracidiphilus sp.]|nr:beta-L-arabinofuranosidase domain-containing protein [Terracidiphilus sp.]
MKKVDRRNFVKAVAMAPLLVSTTGALGEPSRISADTGERSKTGGADERLNLTLRRVVEGDSPRYSDDFLLADVKPTAERRFTEYSGDLSGRYVGALATAARVYGIEAPQLDSLVNKIIALQKPEGYFGSTFHFENPTDADMALLWGNGRLLVGLLEYYRFRPSERVLAASRQIGDFLVRVSPLMLSKEIRDAFGAQHFASSYICWTQQTEGLAMLYSVTKDERYRKLAESIAAVIERRPGDHVHGYLTSLRGVMELHASTKDPKLLSQCERAWQDITASRDLLLTGGVPEGWSPNNHRTEGCGEADWVRLNLQLWNATENQKYLSFAERAIFNELAFNQFATGDFGHRVYTDTGLPAAGAARAWWCCTLHGLRCFPDIQDSAFRATRSGISYEVPVQGKIESPLLSATAESDLSHSGTVRIRITRATKEKARLSIRKPAWAESVSLRVKQTGSMSPLDAGSADAERVWTAGDLIEVKYEMKLRAEKSGEDREIFWFGPWLLGVSAADNPAYFNELTTGNRLFGTPEAALVTNPRRPPFFVPVATAQTDYAQAEYPDQPGRVILRPIAEQTGQATTSWELRLLKRKS